MPAIRISGFKGLAPAISPTKLAEGAAQNCLNARVEGSSLVPERQATEVEDLPTGTDSIYKWRVASNEIWLYSTEGESFVESPVIADVHNRIYIGGGDFPRYSAYAVATSGWQAGQPIVSNPQVPTTTYRLGVPAPSEAPSVQKIGTPDEATVDVIYTTSYVFTYVTQYGEEGPPSAPTSLIEWQEGHTKRVNFPTNPTGNYAFGAGSLKRIYRTATGSSSTEFLFVGECPIAQDEFNDTLMDSELGEVMPSTNWYRPLDDDLEYAPDGPLKKLVLMPGGFLAGFAGKNVAFSEAYLPHAWNPANTLTTESEIVTIVSTTFGLVVLTKTRPYVAVGTTPDVMSLALLDINQACLSAKSAVELDGEVIYASPDGLVSIRGNQTQLITDGLITRRQWQAYNPSTMIATSFEGRYYAFYNDGTNTRALIYDRQSPDAPLMELELYAKTFFEDAEDDALYMNVDDKLVTFGTGNTYEMTWKSKKYFLPVDMTLAWGRVIADGRVQFRIYMDGVKVFDRRVEDEVEFRLPPKTRGRELEVEIVEAPHRIDQIVIATDRAET